MRPGRAFQAALLLATLVPFVAVALPRVPFVIAALTLLATVSGTHVMATIYLYLSRGSFSGVTNAGTTIFLSPAFAIAAVFIVLLAAPLTVTMAFMLVYIHFGVWHFGRQNLGVMAFSARISGRRPLSRFERFTIMTAVVAGVFGAYSAFAPALLLSPAFFPFDVGRVEPFMSRAWYIGAAIYVCLVPIAGVGLWLRRNEYDLASLTSYLASVGFFLPLYLSRDPLIAVASWTTAHGLQYLVFLGSHAAGRARWTLVGLLPIVLFLCCAGAGYGIWTASAGFRSLESPFVAKLAIATTIALTLAHYWVDMFIWRFSSLERRRWLTSSYAFLGQS